MKSDPIYLFQELTWKASLGVLSVAGNVCKIILAEIFGVVKVGQECLKDFSAVCCEEAERFESMDETLSNKTRNNKDDK